MAPVHPDLTDLVGRRLAELGFGGERISYRQAAKRAEGKGSHVSPETIRKLHIGTHSGEIKDGTVAGLADALGVTRADILRAMHQQAWTPLPEWQPPEVANRMTLRQRRVVEAVIFAFTDERQLTGTESDQLEKKPTGGSATAPSLPVDQAHIDVTPDRHVVLARLGEALEMDPASIAEVVTFSQMLSDRARRKRYGS